MNEIYKNLKNLSCSILEIHKFLKNIFSVLVSLISDSPREFGKASKKLSF